MKRLVFAVLIVAISGLHLAATERQNAPRPPAATKPASAVAAAQAPAPAASHPALPGPAEQTALVKEYCATCHSERGKAGQL